MISALLAKVGYSQCIRNVNIKDQPQDVVPVILILSEDYQLQVALFFLIAIIVDNGKDCAVLAENTIPEILYFLT